MKKILIVFLLAGLSAVLSAGVKSTENLAYGPNGVWQYGVRAAGNYSTAYLWIPPNTRKIKGLLIGMDLIMENALLQHPSIRKIARENDLALILSSPNWGNRFNYDPKDKHKHHLTLQKMLDDLAGVSGHPEISTAPWITTGHSAGTGFAWHPAYWKPERTITILGFKGGVKEAPAWDKDAKISNVPLLHLAEQYVEFANPGKDRLYYFHKAMQPEDGSVKQNPDQLFLLLFDPGSGHFELSDKEADFMAFWIGKAMKARVNPDGSLKPVDKTSGYLIDKEFRTNRHSAAPYNEYKGPRNEAFWVFDKETAEYAEKFRRSENGKKDQMVTIKDKNGNPLDITKDGYPTVNISALQFQVEGAFLDKVPEYLHNKGTALGHARGPITFRICGWYGWGARKLNDNTFRYACNRFAPAGRGRTVILLAENAGDKEFRHAVQPVMFNFPAAIKTGKEQSITFEPMENLYVKNLNDIKLQATASSGLPVEFYVNVGPCYIDYATNTLKFSDIPVNAKFPMEVRITAWQWGKEGVFQSAKPVERSFRIESAPPASLESFLLKEFSFDAHGNSNDAVKGKAMMFDGKTSVPVGRIPPVKGQLSVSLYVKIAAKDMQRNSRKLVFGNSDDYWKTPMSIFFDGTHYRGLLKSAQFFCNPKENNPADRYVSLIWTVNGNRHSFYLDGKRVGQYDDPKYKLPAEGLDFFLGGINQSNFTGLIDEVKIYGKELSESEIKKITGK